MALPDYRKYKLISVDVFDTLLLRTVAKAVDVFEAVWEEAGKRGIAGTSISKKEFMRFRMEMERLARAGATNREVSLHDIYRQFPSFIAKDLQALEELETECEMKCCYANPVLLSWLEETKRHGCRLALVSDMYLSAAQIKEILGCSRIDTALFDEVIVSNEYGCSKQDGALFDILLGKYPQYAADEILHIGDNRNADYNQPLRKGMQAFHYDAIPEKMYSIYDYEKIRHDVPQPSILSLRKLAASMAAETYDEAERTAYELGSAVIGPVLSLYVSWVCRRLQESGIGRIYPFMREGYVLGRLLSKESEVFGLNLAVHPIYVSRKVTYIPSIKAVTREEIENMIGARNLTIEESIRLMGLDPSAFMEFEEHFAVRYKESHKIRWQDLTLKEAIIGQFLIPENSQRIEAYIRQERKKLIGYLRQEIGDFENAATIDIGFFGRIQMWMEQCLDLEDIPHRMKHFLAVGVTGDKVFNGMDFEGAFGTFAENMDLIPTIHRTTDVMEKLVSVTEGSTVGYQEYGGKIVPLQDEGVDNAHLTDIVFKGIFDFQKLWLDFRKRKPEAAEGCIMDRRGTLKILHRLIDMPRKCEAEMLAGLEADTNFGTGYRKGIITKEHLELGRKKGLDFLDKCNVSYTYQGSNVTWPKGAVTLLDEYYYVRRALKNGTQNEIIKSMQEVVEQVERDGIKEVALYGAGENGRQFYFLCRMYHIGARCFIDRKESIWGTRKEGVEVVGLDEAIRRGCNDYIVTSLFSISEITDFILEKYKGLGREPRVYSV